LVSDLWEEEQIIAIYAPRERKSEAQVQTYYLRVTIITFFQVI